jgi:uncharacterized protein YhaN
MRFRRVSFRNFGPFAEQTFDLAQSRCGLHLCYGRNEAGKSSALRGLRYFLFGFPERTKDDFVHKMTGFRIHAVLENSRGDVLECVRRKGRKETLRAGDDKTVVAEECLRAFMGGMSEEQFEQLFGLDHQLLAEGGRLIAEGKGDLGEAIFAAGAGLAGLRRLGIELDEQKGKLYRERGQNQDVAVALRTLKALDERVRACSLPAEAYATKEEECRAARQRARTSRQELDGARALLARLQRYQAALPTIWKLRAARERLRDLEAARVVPDEFGNAYRESEKRLLEAQTSLKDIDVDIDKLRRDIAALELPDALLAAENTIDQLRKEVSIWSEQKEEALQHDSRKREMEAKARDIFRELTGSTKLEEARDYRLTVEQTNRIREVARSRRDLERDLKNHGEEIAKLQRAIGDIQSQLASSPDPPELDKLRRTVDLVAAERRIEDELREATESAAQQETKIRNALGRLMPPCPVPLEQIPALPLPQLEAIQWHRERLGTLKDQLDRSADELRLTEQDLAALEAQIRAVVRDEAIPTEQELVQARRERDLGLYRVRRRLAGHTPADDDGSFIERHAAAGTLMDAVEASVRQADALADRLRREADRISRWQNLQSQCREKRQKLELVEIATQSQKEQYQRAATDWQALWQASGVTPDGPEAMAAWLNQLSPLRERIEAWHGAVRQRDSLARRRDELLEWLRDIVSETSGSRGLSEALAVAQERVNAAQEARIQRKTSAAELERLRREMATLQAEKTELEHELKSTLRNWAEAVAPLRLSRDADSTTVEICLDRIGEMQVHLKDARIKAARIGEIEQRRDVLVRCLNDLRQRLDPACVATAPDRILPDFEEIDRALASARDRRTSHGALKKQLESKIKDRERLAGTLRDAEASLKALALEAGVAEPGEIPEAIEQSRRRAQAERDLHDLETTLVEQARGIASDEFENAALAQSASIENTILKLEERILLEEQLLTQADIDANQAEVQLKEWHKASDEAARACQEKALWARRLQAHVAEYATLHLARLTLDRAVERYRCRNQDSMLARAGSFFERLTDGAFAALDLENEDGKPVLMALRGDRGRLDASVSVDGLSDGTRDQLFLALRLAGIEKHLADREPMPLVIDDVLVNFDNRRALATLQCIAELARKTQVLLFTHHRHIVNLARRSSLPNLRVHEFPRSP